MFTLRRLSLVTSLLFAFLSLANAAEPSKDALSSKQVKQLIASATTPEDHQKLARHYTAMAARHEAEAVEHEELAEYYAKNPQYGVKTPLAPNTPQHCKSYAEHCRKAAKEMRALAAAHEQMANSK